MKTRSCYLFVFNGFADWEPALVTSGLNAYSDFTIKTFSVDGGVVRSMGNLKIMPDMKLDEVKVSDFDLLLLPGGESWTEGGNTEISSLVKETFDSGRLLAGICAATTFLAKQGAFNEIRHTSNGLEYLQQHVPGYNLEHDYVNLPAVLDKNVLSAKGAGMVEFAYEVFKYFNLFKQEELDGWLSIYKNSGVMV